jgi:hypothetical protein
MEVRRVAPKQVCGSEGQEAKGDLPKPVALCVRKLVSGPPLDYPSVVAQSPDNAAGFSQSDGFDEFAVRPVYLWK